jgi:hypothetical protein
MARARGIKPGFFTNDVLVELPFATRLLFIGLWTIADKEGRLLDRPKKIKMEVFPADNVDCEEALNQLTDKGFLFRYEANGIRYIQVRNWRKHQNPHMKETDSLIPAPEIPRLDPEIPVQAGLIPDSGLRTPDSPNPALHASLPTETWDEWIAFRKTRRWPVDATTLKKQLNVLAPHSTDVQRSMLDTSMQSNWQGLFAPKGNGKAAPAPKTPPTPEQITQAQREAAEANRRQLAKALGPGALKGMP